MSGSRCALPRHLLPLLICTTVVGYMRCGCLAREEEEEGGEEGDDGKWEREQERGEGSVPNVPAQFS